jgi:hypothetical protein
MDGLKNLLNDAAEVDKLEAEEEAAAAAAAAGTEEGGAEDTKKKKSSTKKKSPAAKRCVEVLVDKVEDSPITVFNIDDKDPQYVKGVALMKAAIKKDLQTTVALTVQSRQPNLDLEDVSLKHVDSEGKDLDRGVLIEHKSGAKLDEVLKTSKKIVKHFKKEAVDADQIKEAEALQSEIRSAKRNDLMRMLSLATPHLPVWVVATILGSIKGGIMEPISTLLMSQVADDATRPNAKELLPIGCLKVLLWFTTKELVGILGSIMNDKANSDLKLTLKNTVMESLLRQDIEYFDKHKVGVLQERLNRDTAELSGDALSVPANIIQNATFVLTNTYLLWQKSKTLTLIGSAILPLVAIGQYYLIEFYRTLQRKQSNYREMASASTIETLTEIRTVREHVMEPQELKKFRQVSAYQAHLVQQGNGFQRIVGSVFWYARTPTHPPPPPPPGLFL